MAASNPDTDTEVELEPEAGSDAVPEELVALDGPLCVSGGVGVPEVLKLSPLIIVMLVVVATSLMQETSSSCRPAAVETFDSSV